MASENWYYQWHPRTSTCELVEQHRTWIILWNMFSNLYITKIKSRAGLNQSSENYRKTTGKLLKIRTPKNTVIVLKFEQCGSAIMSPKDAERQQYSPWSDCSTRRCLIWDCTVCSALSVRKPRIIMAYMYMLWTFICTYVFLGYWCVMITIDK